MAERHGGPGVWIATVGPVGYTPLAPGTFGSLVGLALVAVVARLALSRAGTAFALAALAVLLLFIGVWAAGLGERYFGRIDPRPVVIDEVMGQLVTFIAAPHLTWKWLVAGFLLFRFFDILKPPPVRNMERLPGGWGIMMDDALAGMCSLAVLLVAAFVMK